MTREANRYEVARGSWRVDPDGMLRITARILKEGVFPYSLANYGAELPKDVLERFGDRTTVHEYINADSFTEGVLATLEGKSVVADAHEWEIIPDDDKAELKRVNDEGKEFVEIGAVAGKPWVDDKGFICADLLIKNASARKRIMDRELVDISGGYKADVYADPGEFDGAPYDLEQKVTRFNHVAILEKGKGRCGRDVCILNHIDTKGETMSVIVQRQIGNAMEEFAFESEKDAKEAERMNKLVAEYADRLRQNAADAAAEKEKEVEGLKKENEELGAEKVSLEQRLEALLARLEKLVGLEVREQEGDEDAILKEELNEADAAKAKAEVAKENSLEGRRKAVVSAVARHNEMDAPDMPQEAIDAQFRLMAKKARKSAEAKGNRGRSSEIAPPPGGFKRQNAGEKDRYFERCKARNAK